MKRYRVVGATLVVITLSGGMAFAARGTGWVKALEFVQKLARGLFTENGAELVEKGRNLAQGQLASTNLDEIVKSYHDDIIANGGGLLVLVEGYKDANGNKKQIVTTIGRGPSEAEAAKQYFRKSYLREAKPPGMLRDEEDTQLVWITRDGTSQNVKQGIIPEPFASQTLKLAQQAYLAETAPLPAQGVSDSGPSAVPPAPYSQGATAFEAAQKSIEQLQNTQQAVEQMESARRAAEQAAMAADMVEVARRAAESVEVARRAAEAVEQAQKAAEAAEQARKAAEQAQAAQAAQNSLQSLPLPRP